MIEEVRKIIISKSEDIDYKYHISVVVKYALELAKIKNTDLELIELAALLHDVGRLNDENNDKNHELTGMPIAEEILINLRADKQIIKEIKHCIESHRGSQGIEPKTLPAQIIANADAMSHFDMVPLFFYWRRENGNFEEAVEWVEKKLQRDWEKKLTLPEAKELIKEKYLAAKTLIDANKNKK